MILSGYKVLPVPVPGNFNFTVHDSESASAADYCYNYSVRVAGHPKPIGWWLNYRGCRYKPPRTSGGSLALPADSSPLWCAYRMLWRRSSAQEQARGEQYCGDRAPGHSLSQRECLKTLDRSARLFSLLSVPDNMIKGDGCSETRVR